MSDYRKSRGRLVGGPMPDTELDAMVADIYLGGESTPDDAQVEYMTSQFRLLRDAFDDTTDEDPLVNVTREREERTYFRSRFEAALIWLYRTKYDRLVGLAIASAAILIGIAGLLGLITFSTQAFHAGTLTLMGVLVGAGVFESGRLGYLARQNWNHIDDVAASLPTSVVRGHHRVHQEEQAMLHRARRRKTQKLMLVELWNGQRSTPGTRQAIAVDREVDRLIRENPDCKVRSAFSATPETWPHREALAQQRCGKIDQQFFTENPLQVDAILTDEEAILSFPRGKGDRGLAFVFRSKGMVKELWSIFNSQVGDGRTAESISIQSPDDIQQAKVWVHDDERSSSSFPRAAF